MDEALKTKHLRSDVFFRQYLGGILIDIGAGQDLVLPHAERFDLEEGDANFITKFRKRESYDSVHSSHCLEHMVDPVHALHEWWQLLKPGGHLVLVVPEEDLYEQGFWPSRFNGDHKCSFRIGKKSSWSPASFDIEELVMSLPNATILSATIQDDKYDYSLQSFYPPKWFRAQTSNRMINIINKRIPQFIPLLRIAENYAFKKYGFPIDQTRRNALAQIQIVAKKM